MWFTSNKKLTRLKNVYCVQYATAATKSSLSNGSQNRERTHHSRVSTFSQDRITRKVFSNIEKRFLFKFEYRFSKPLINGLLPLKQLPGELLYSKENGRLRKLRIEADYKAQDVG